jgi:hypothetical protein
MQSRILLIYLIAVSLLSGCAYQGVVVDKRSRPLPFPESLGVDGMYSFKLRNHSGEVHSQMVTAYVFYNYRVGDYFNDLQPPPVQPEKEMRAPMYRANPELQEPPVPLGPEPMRTRKPSDQPYHPVRTTSIHHSSKHGTKIAQATTKKHRSRTSKLAVARGKAHRSRNA